MASWTDKLSGEVYTRLCECRNKKEDIPLMVNAKWESMVERGMDKRGYTKEDALVNILELLEANSQFVDPDIEEWKFWTS